MNLVVFGDSWTFGDELGDMSKEYRNSFNIGGIVFKNYKFDNYYNFSINGGSNSHIITQLVGYINSDIYDKDNLILVGLTSPSRKIRFNNISKTPTTWPAWDYESYINYSDPSLYKNDEFEKWWKTSMYVNVNNRNDAFNYLETTLAIKSILSNHSKYIVWQSIDISFYDSIEDDFKEVEYEWDTINLQHNEPNKMIFNKNYVNKVLQKNTTDTQIWINLSEPSWIDWLKNNFVRNEVLQLTSDHPNEIGIQLWFDNILKKYIDKVLDTSK